MTPAPARYPCCEHCPPACTAPATALPGLGHPLPCPTCQQETTT